MKKENKILLLLILFSFFVILVIELTSPSFLYRDPWMFKHFDAAQYILEEGKAGISAGNFSENFGWSFLYSGNLIFFPVPVLLGGILSLLSGLEANFVFNHFYFLILIAALSFFVLFREIFRNDWLAFGLSLIIVLFPFEPLYYKITLHGWFFVRIFSSISLFFLVRMLKENSSLKSKNFLFLLFFSLLGMYSDKSAFAILLFPLILFFVVYFFFEKQQTVKRKKFLNYFVFVFLFLALFSVLTILNQTRWIIDALLYNLLNLNFIPSFINPELPFSEFYLKKGFSYLLIRYFIPSLILFVFLFLNFSKIKSFVSENQITKSFVLSQAIFYFLIGSGMLFSFAFISSRGASMIFLFLSFICFIGLFQMKKNFLKYSLISVFFIFVLIIPLLFFTQTPQFKYEQFNEKHLSSINWIKENLGSESNIYSDVKMAKAIAVKTDLNAVNPRHEFNYFMEKHIIPIYFSNELEPVLLTFEKYEITHLALTKEMSSLMVQPANELLKPATHLSKFDFSNSFDKIFENKQVRIYEIKETEKN